MEYTEDPYKHIGYLQQCLSNDKRSVGLLIGAGCPTSILIGDAPKQPLIPDIAGVSAMVRKSIYEDGVLSLTFKKIESQLAKDGKENANVEHLLSHIRALKSVAGKEEVRGLNAEQLEQIDVGICEVINTLASKELPYRATPYHKLAAWIDGTARGSPIEIFTTNYDLLMEQALEESKVAYFDGFAGARKSFFDLRSIDENKLPTRWVRLWKLHGSINWYQDDKLGVIRTSASESGLRRVIHPTHLKYDESRRMPYLAMLDRLRAFLKLPMATLIVCGYSFNDEHINDVLVQGLQANQSAVVFGLLFGEISKYEIAVKAASSRSNLSLFARDGAVIGGTQRKVDATPYSATRDRK